MTDKVTMAEWKLQGLCQLCGAAPTKDGGYYYAQFPSDTDRASWHDRNARSRGFKCVSNIEARWDDMPDLCMDKIAAGGRI